MLSPCWMIAQSSPNLSVAGAVGIALGRNGTEEALRMFQRVGVGGEAGLRQSRGHDAGMRRLAGVERLRHGAKIGHDAGALRRPERDRDRGARRRPACGVWRRPPPRRRHQRCRSDASLSGDTSARRAAPVRPRSHSRRHRRRACPGRWRRAPRPPPKWPAPARWTDGRAAKRHRSPARAPRCR